ncbi:MAG: elongation factor P [Balneolales bacterium]|nr:elongation factor P [Balneolales bacterium]
MPKVSTADFKNGMTIIVNTQLYQIIEFQHVKPGKGPAFVRTKLKGVETGKIIDKTFRSGESMESVRVERHPYQFLYFDGSLYHFMHTQTYEQVGLAPELVDRPEFMKESQEVTLVVNAEIEKILFTEMADHVELTVSQTDPGVRGDTAQGASKPATLETGAVVQVPLFINEGDKLKVDTRTKTYLERVKS